MEPEELQQMFEARLKAAGRRSMIRHARTVLQVFVASTAPVSSKDVLFAVKRFDPLISRSTVHKVLNELVQCGLATIIPPERHPQPTRYLVAVESTKPPCSHPHWVCKDCGAAIPQPETPAPRLLVIQGGR